MASYLYKVRLLVNRLQKNDSLLLKIRSPHFARMTHCALLLPDKGSKTPLYSHSTPFSVNHWPRLDVIRRARYSSRCVVSVAKGNVIQSVRQIGVEVIYKHAHYTRATRCTGPKHPVCLCPFNVAVKSNIGIGSNLRIPGGLHREGSSIKCFELHEMIWKKIECCRPGSIVAILEREMCLFLVGTKAIVVNFLGK